MYTEKNTLQDVLKHKKATEILAKYQVPCLGCPMAAYEMGALTLEQIGQTYGINIKKMLGELNKK